MRDEGGQFLTVQHPENIENDTKHDIFVQQWNAYYESRSKVQLLLLGSIGMGFSIVAGSTIFVSTPPKMISPPSCISPDSSDLKRF